MNGSKVNISLVMMHSRDPRSVENPGMVQMRPVFPRRVSFCFFQRSAEGVLALFNINVCGDVHVVNRDGIDTYCAAQAPCHFGEAAC